VEARRKKAQDEAKKREAERRASIQKAKAEAADAARRLRERPAIERELLLAAKRYKMARDTHDRMVYDFQYNTVSTRMDAAHTALRNYNLNVYIPAVRAWQLALSKFAQNYGPVELRDFAIEHGFLSLI
jgi:hypothetical protein